MTPALICGPTQTPASRNGKRPTWLPQLAPDADAGQSARRHAREILRRHGVPQRKTEITLLLLTELVTNSARHAPPDHPINVALTLNGPSVEVEATDTGAPVHPPLSRPPHRARGFGLVIVGRLARRWGIAPNPPNQVWFEV